MRIIETIAEMRKLRRESRRVSLVPTMGFLHQGHQRLIAEAAERGGLTLVSIFVNPLQFGPDEDYDRYPRDLARDVAAARSAGADVVFAPAVSEMYPAGASTTRIDLGPITQVLCGRTRPVHFSGVATVVAKLFHIVRPDFAFFGAKDAQQVAVVRRMVRDLNFDVDVVRVPTVREANGLACSSRNRYLTDEERERAGSLFRALTAAQSLYIEGERRQAALIDRVLVIVGAAAISPEYVEVRSWDRLDQVGETLDERPVLLALAARIGRARLIDNVLLGTDREEQPAEGEHRRGSFARDQSDQGRG